MVEWPIPMDADPKRVRELFHAASDLPITEREAYIIANCNDDDALLAQVRTLIASHERDDGHFDRAAEVHRDVPTVLGDRYHVRGVIGCGRQAQVLEADDAMLQRTVAIKLLNEWPLYQHFNTEALRLAQLTNIDGVVPIFDFGKAPDGRPYLVMPKIHGVPITEHVRKLDYDEVQIIQLVCRVCRAVHCAHEAGFIHGDLTPRNILVDSEGRPHVLDFGISRLIGDAPRNSKSIRGTPGYAAPEVADANPASARREVDVYSLGVILFELLSGLPIQRICECLRPQDTVDFRTLYAQYRIALYAVYAIVASSFQLWFEAPGFAICGMFYAIQATLIGTLSFGRWTWSRGRALGRWRLVGEMGVLVYLAAIIGLFSYVLLWPNNAKPVVCGFLVGTLVTLMNVVGIHVICRYWDRRTKARCGMRDEFASIVDRCVAEDAETRYQSVESLHDALRLWLDGESIVWEEES